MPGIRDCNLARKWLIVILVPSLLYGLVCVFDKIITSKIHSSETEKDDLSKKLEIVEGSAQNQFHCVETTVSPKIQRRGPYWVLYDHVQVRELLHDTVLLYMSTFWYTCQGSQEFKCNETVTFATQSTFEMLPNVIPLLERWKGKFLLVPFRSL